MTVSEPIELSPRLRRFHQCEGCGYDFLTDEGERGCHWGECPYLPEEIDVWCPTCRYDFVIEDGNPECGDPPSCRFAREVAPLRVATLKAWLALQRRPA